MAKLYLKPTGSTCYNEKGVTFPRQINISLKGIVKTLGGIDVRWEKSETNQPAVIVFYGDALTKRNVNATMQALNVEILCREHE